VFNQDDNTNVYFPNPIGGENNQHPLNFSADNLNGALDGGTSYLENVVYILDGNVVNQAAYWAGFEDATQRSVQITITDDTPTLLYYWCQNHLNMGNSIAIIEPGSEGWQLLAKGKNFRGQWAQTNDYKPGDVVRRGGNLYIALRDIADDGSSLDYLADGFWELVNPSQNWIGYWTAEASYEVGDVVLFNGDSYRCNFPHTASISPIPNFPGDNGEGIDYWDLLIESPADVGMSSRGDLLTFDLSRDEVGDGSSFGFTDIEIGADGQVLSVDNDGSANYTSWGEVARTFYVSNLGLDDNTDSLRG